MKNIITDLYLFVFTIIIVIIIGRGDWDFVIVTNKSFFFFRIGRILLTESVLTLVITKELLTLSSSLAVSESISQTLLDESCNGLL